MNKQKLEDDIKKRRINPYFSTSYGKSIPSVSIEQMLSLSDLLIAISEKNEKFSSCCNNPQKYKNGMGNMLFWSCKSCGADLGDIND
jgi:hypothetical protein